MKPIIITVCHTHNHPGFKRLERTVKQHGWASAHLTPQWEGFPTKLRSVLEYVPRLLDGGFDLVVFLDAFDSMVFGTPADLDGRLNSINFAQSALCSCEKAPWPDADKAPLYPANPKSEFCYVNSGGYLCSVDYLSTLLDGCFDKSVIDDQRFLTDKYLADPVTIQRDDGCNVFQTMGHCYSFPHQKWQDTFDIVDGRPVNKITGTSPLFWHAQGGGSSNPYHQWLPGFDD